MALTVLMTTTSFAIDLHYCGDTLIDFSFVQEVESCGMNTMQTPLTCEPAVSEKSCCSDEQLVVDGRDDLSTSFDTLAFEQQTFLVSLFYAYVNPFKASEQNLVPFKAYSPPLLIRDVQALHETYLI